MVKLLSSVLSVAMGVSQFLLIGPCRLLSRHGPLNGILTFGFLLLTINCYSCLILKFLLLAFAYGGHWKAYPDSIYEDKVSAFLGSCTVIWMKPYLLFQGMMGFYIWICINILPQFILSIATIILSSGGLKNAWRVITKFPALIMIPICTFWTFGPVTTSNSSCKGLNCKTEAEGIEISFWCNTKASKIKISFWSTWINILLTLSGSMIFSRIIMGDKSSRCLLFNTCIGIYPPDWFGILLNFWFMYFLLVAIMIVIIIQFVDNCNCSCCCNCCLNNCYPIKKITYLNVNNMDDNNTTEENIEMS